MLVNYPFIIAIVEPNEFERENLRWILNIFNTKCLDTNSQCCCCWFYLSCLFSNFQSSFTLFDSPHNRYVVLSLFSDLQKHFSSIRMKTFSLFIYHSVHWASFCLPLISSAIFVLSSFRLLFSSHLCGGGCGIHSANLPFANWKINDIEWIFSIPLDLMKLSDKRTHSCWMSSVVKGN